MLFTIVITGCARPRSDQHLNNSKRYGNAYSYEHLILSDTYYSQNELSLAIEHIKLAIKADKNDYLLKVKLATYLIELGEYKKAKRQLQNAALFAPSSVEVALAKANLYHKQNNNIEALKCANKATSFNSNDPSPQIWLGNFYLKKDPQKAISHYKSALEIDPHNLQSHKQLIKLYKTLNNSKLSQHHQKKYDHLSNPTRN